MISATALSVTGGRPPAPTRVDIGHRTSDIGRVRRGLPPLRAVARVLAMYELVFLTGARAGAVVPVNKSLIGGRSPDCSLEVPDPHARRQHARFNWDGALLLVVDNGSSNGTYVNDQ